MRINRFLKYIESGKVYSKHTVKAYASDLAEFQDFCRLNGHLRCEEHEISDFQVLRSWIADLANSGISAKSVNRKMSALKSYYDYLIRGEYIRINPADKLTRLKESKKLPEFITQANINDLIESDLFPNDFRGLRDKLVLDILYSAGIRRSELIRLRTDDVDLLRNELRVLGKRNKERIIPFPVALRENINAYLNFRGEINSATDILLITESGKEMYPKLVYRIVTEYLGYLTSAKKKSPHTLRHTYATQLLNEGADINAVKELLGHSGLGATQIYTHNSFKKISQVYNQAHPRAKK